MINLRPYQRHSIDAIYNYFQFESGNPLVVIPTGGGKSIVIGQFVKEVLQAWPGQRILILSHVKELIQQNHDKIMLCWPGAPAGIYSASLGMRQPRHPIVVATIQSVYKKAEILGHRDLLFIDECHLLGRDANGMYSKMIAGLLKVNPKMKIIGLSATPFRLDSGMLHEGEDVIFTDIAYELPILTLIEEGYLTMPISRPSKIQADLSEVGTVAGEYNKKEMAAAFDETGFLTESINEAVTLIDGRRSIAVFCAGVDNSEHVARELCARGIHCESLDGEMRQEKRDDILKRFKSGALRCLSSVGIVTTGFDAPNIDCLILMRATKSPGLYMQIIGRGSRVIYAGGFDLETRQGRLEAIAGGPKPDFLVLDYGGNIERHGPITHVKPPHKKKKGEESEKTVRHGIICELCRSYWPVGTRECLTCGSSLVQERDTTKDIEEKASTHDIVTATAPVELPQWWDVDTVSYYQHNKANAVPTMRVEYACKNENTFHERFREWVCFEHPEDSYPRRKAVQWWNKRAKSVDRPKDDAEYYTNHPKLCPATVGDALSFDAGYPLKQPKRILVRKNNKFWEIIDYEFAA